MPIRLKWTLAGAVAAILIVAAVAMKNSNDPPPAAPVGPTGVVVKGPLVVSVTEAGEVEADRRRVIANELPWPVVIKEVVPEGTMVKSGQIIIRFECRELTDAINQANIEVTAANNSYVSARENLLLKRVEMANNVRKAEQALEDAKQDLRRYKEGEGPIKLSDAEREISIAKRDLALAQEKLDFKLKVNKDPSLNSPYSAKEVEADNLGVERLKLALGKAISTRDMLVQYDHPRDLRKQETAGEDAKLARERARLDQKTQTLMAEAEEKAKKLTFDMQTAKLNDLLENERKLVVKATDDGLVIYDMGDRQWRPDKPPVGVGEKMNPRQQLLVIPDMTTLQIKTKVYEAIIEQVRPGLQAYARLDAKADITLSGKVEKVGVLPDSQNRWLNPSVKVYAVIVKLDSTVEGLKPGMTAQVELVLARLENVFSVPVAAIFTEQQNTYCWNVTAGNAPKRVPVKVGLMNDARVQVLSGLSEGDRVLLAAPASTGSHKTQAEPSPATPGPDPKGPAK